MEVDADIGCMACGAANPIGLGLVFAEEGDAVRAEFTPLAWHQGYDGLVHGGIIAMLLDEAMAQALLARGMAGVTAELGVKFRAPLAPGARVVVSGRIEAARGRLVETAGTLCAGDRLIAEAQAVFAVDTGRD